MTIVQWLLLPAFVQVLWVAVTGIRMGAARTAAVKSGKVTLDEIALDASRWPDEARKLANNYDNQFQLPALFFALLPLVILLVKVDWLTVTLAWVFVASRILHSLIHTGSNAVLKRGQAFLIGFAALTLMWAWFALRLYVIG